jgi:hypothetical protein
MGTYLFGNNNDQYSIAVLHTIGDRNRSKAKTFHRTSSLGFGIMRNQSNDSFDFMIPLTGKYGYNITDNFAVGANLGLNFNLNDFRNRGYFFMGFYLDFRLGKAKNNQ